VLYDEREKTVYLKWNFDLNGRTRDRRGRRSQIVLTGIWVRLGPSCLVRRPRGVGGSRNIPIVDGGGEQCSYIGRYFFITNVRYYDRRAPHTRSRNRTFISRVHGNKYRATLATDVDLLRERCLLWPT